MPETTTDQIHIPDKLYFKIREVSVLAQVPASVLRFWETEFKKIRPKRTPDGQRLYRRHDVELILQIKHLLYEKKFTIPGARQYLNASKKSIHEALPPPTLDEICSELESIREMLSR